LPATASGIYGGSATGGVINIILRNDYDGTEVKVIYGNTFQSDVAERRIDLSTGFDSEDGRTNLLLSGSYSDLNPLTTSERESLLERYYAIARANAPEVLLPPNNPPLGSTANIRSANGSNLVLRDTTPLNSPITHIPLGYAGTSTDGGQALVANDGSYNLGLADGLQHATSTGSQIGAAPRNAAFRAVLRQEFTSRVSAFLETGADQVRAVGPLAYTNGAQISPYRVSAAAPNNPFNTDILVTVPSNSFSYAETPGTETERYRATGGLIVALPGEWRATAEYTWARTRIDYVGSGGFSTGADTAAVLNGTVDVLRDTNIYPVDLMSYLTVEPFSGVQEIGFRNAALRFAGPILELPGGAMTLSTLLEYSNEKFPGTTLDRPGQHIFYPGRSSSAASVYVETVIPLVSAKNRRAGVEALEVQLAARADEYRTLGRTGFVTVGSTTPIVTARNETQSINPTIAIRYEPLEDLVLRTSYGTGFVAPTVAQLASSFNVTPFTIVDPRRGNTSTSLAPGQLVQGGNPNLDPEKSESWSAGIIWSPQFASGLRVSLDYTRIRKTDNIATYPSGLGIINDEAQFPDRVQRGERLPGDPAGWAGPITLLDLSLLNVAGAKAETLDLQLDYALETAIGTFSVSGVATRQMHLESQALASLPIQENVGLSYINPQEYVGNLELKWRHHAWTASWFSRYYDSYFTADPAVASNAAHIRLQGNGGRVPSQSYHDLTVNWASDYSGRDVSGFLTGTEFQLGIRNIFDKTPPFDANIYNTVRTFHSPLGDPLGRTWQAAITKRF
jgi:outer membrane receptor protein involved in Fe transport